MQKMINRLSETCKEYGMEINVKKTKVMMMNGTGRIKKGVKLNNVPLERVTRFKYLGSWITDDAKSDDDIRARVGMAKAEFWQNKELMRRNIRFKTKLKILNTESRTFPLDISLRIFPLLPFPPGIFPPWYFCLL